MFSDDCIDSPHSSDVKSPLDYTTSSESCGNCPSDDQSSLGTVDTEDDTSDVTPGKPKLCRSSDSISPGKPDLSLSLDCALSYEMTRTRMKNPYQDDDDDDDDDDEFDARAIPRRSTSLKTCKTPPGSDRRKKEVRFADALGLDLESIKHIINTSEPPIVPASAVRHLAVPSESEITLLCLF